MKKIRILLADDHALLRMGLKALLATESDMTVVGEAADGREAVRLARELRPDVVVMDLLMPGLTGAKATAEIRRADPSVRVLVLTSFGTAQELLDALDNGADGVLLKDTAGDELSAAIRRTARGERTVPPSVARLVAEGQETKRLSPQQRELLEAVARGLTDREISEMTGLSVAATKHRLRDIFLRIGAANRAEAVAIALKKLLLC